MVDKKNRAEGAMITRWAGCGPTAAAYAVCLDQAWSDPSRRIGKAESRRVRKHDNGYRESFPDTRPASTHRPTERPIAPTSRRVAEI